MLLLNTSTAASSPSRPGAGRPRWSGWPRRGGPTWRRGGFRRRTRPAPRAGAAGAPGRRTGSGRTTTGVGVGVGVGAEHLLVVDAAEAALRRGDRLGGRLPTARSVAPSGRDTPLLRGTAPRRRRGSARLGWSGLRCQAQ